jgi:hypothetical protein
MASLIISYPESPLKNRVLYSGDLQTMIHHLDSIELRLKREQISKCGKVFVAIARLDNLTLNTCIFNNVDTDDEETIDKNYFIFN